MRGQGILGCSRELYFGAMSSCVCLLCCCCFLIQMHVKINLLHSQSDWKSARAPHSCSGLLQANHTARTEQLQTSVSHQFFGTGPVPACCHLFPAQGNGSKEHQGERSRSLALEISLSVLLLQIGKML